MTTTTEPAPADAGPSPEATRRPPRTGRPDAIAVALLVAIAIVVTWLSIDDDGPDGDRTGLIAFVEAFDVVSADLALERDSAASAAGDPGTGTVALAAALLDARSAYGALDPPALLEDDFAAYLDAVTAEAAATERLEAAIAYGGDVGAAARDLLTANHDVGNRQRALRRAAVALAEGDS